MGDVVAFHRLWLINVGFVTYAIRARDEIAARLELSATHPEIRRDQVRQVRLHQPKRQVQ